MTVQLLRTDVRLYLAIRPYGIGPLDTEQLRMLSVNICYLKVGNDSNCLKLVFMFRLFCLIVRKIPPISSALSLTIDLQNEIIYMKLFNYYQLEYFNLRSHKNKIVIEFQFQRVSQF